MHIPVLLKETIEFLNPQSGEFIVDATIGGGGHAAEVLKKIGDSGTLLGIDLDKEAIADCQSRFADYKNVILVNGNYADLSEILKQKELPKADSLLIDLGFSSRQLEKSGRGFSFLKDEKLDMRYQQETENLTAAEVINQYSEKELADIFWKYGEERNSRKIAKKIIEERKKKRILTTFNLIEIIKKAVPKNYEQGRIQRIHPATKVFQALRIYVNDELGNLEKILKNMSKILKGRAVIISFHSLEDRLVKNYFRNLNKEGKAEILTKKPIRPSEEEIRGNPRSRSAKLRAIII
ncbi:MAG: 16S rRNA (cytosine(1402)-N(4))-methyltransferase RsmH [Patescibacteria group bacterium]